MPDTQTRLAVNLNDTVRFRLTPHGVALYDAHYEALGMKPPAMTLTLRLDADGWCQTQLWNFCNIFGPGMHIGGDVPVETGIEIIRST